MFNVCHWRLSSDVRFDVISTSNLIDHVGLLNLLVTCQPRLKKYVTTAADSYYYSTAHSFVLTTITLCAEKSTIVQSVSYTHLTLPTILRV